MIKIKWKSSISLFLILFISVINSFAQKKFDALDTFHLIYQSTLIDAFNNAFPFDNEIQYFKIIDNDISWYDQKGRQTIINIDSNNVLRKFTYTEGISKIIYNPNNECDYILSTKSDKIQIIHKGIVQYVLSDSSEGRFETFVVNSIGNQVIAARGKEIIIWKIKNGEWKNHIINLDKNIYEISYLNDEILLIGINEGEVILFDLTSMKTKINFTAHKETITSIVTNSAKDKFITCDGYEIKVWNNTTNSTIVPTNITLIAAIEWFNDSIIIIGGVNNAMELWNINQPKLVQTINKPSINLNRIPLDNHSDSVCYLFLKEVGTNIDTMLKLKSTITTIGTNSNNIITLGNNNFDIATYKWNSKKIELLYEMNIYKHIYKGNHQTLLSVESNIDGNKVFVGNKCGLGYFNINEKKVILAVGNHYRSYSQVDLSSFKDLSIFIEDVGMNSTKDANDKYMNATLGWSFYSSFSDKPKKSRLYKEWKRNNPYVQREMPFPIFSPLKNPSGFSIAESKKYIVVYDATGLIQLAKVKNLELILDKKLISPIKKVFFMPNDDLLVVQNNGNIFTYNIDSDKWEKLMEINFTFSDVSYNNKKLLAFTCDNRIICINIDEGNESEIFKNNYGNMEIQNLSFIPNSNCIVWSLNKKLVNTGLEIPVNHAESNDSIITTIKSNPTQNYFIIGNSLGDVYLYKI